MIKLPITTVTDILSMAERDIRYVLTQTGVIDPDGGPLKEVDDQAIMMLLVYDMLTVMKFKERDILALLSRLAFHLMAIGRRCGNREKGNYVLTIADNRYATISDMDDKIYDFKDLVWLEQIPQPLVSFAIVLPVLFQRGTGSLESPSGRLLAKEEKPGHA